MDNITLKNKVTKLKNYLSPKFKIGFIGDYLDDRHSPFPIWNGINQFLTTDFKDNRCIAFPINEWGKYQEFLDFNPDFVLIHETRLHELKNWIYPLQVLRGRGAKIALWFNDLRDLTSDIGYTDPYNCMDAVFLCNKKYLPHWSEYFDCPAYYMPQGCEETEKPKDVKLDHELVFVGDLDPGTHPRRALWWNILNQFWKGVVYNAGDRPQRILFEELSHKLYRSSKISFVSALNVDGYNSNRLYNVLAYGGLALTCYFKGIEDLFENYKDLIWFEAPLTTEQPIIDKATEELVKIKEFIDKNPKKYEEIRMNGWRLSQERHTCRMRILNMLNHLYLDDHEFWGNKT